MDPLLHPREIDKNSMKPATPIRRHEQMAKSNEVANRSHLSLKTKMTKKHSVMPNPTDQWMKLAKSPDKGEEFIANCVDSFGGPKGVHPKRVIQGVGSGLRLIANAGRWSHPQVGPGAENTKRARGQQWRLVMAYSGLEVMAKALQGNFANQGGPGVRKFVTYLGGNASDPIQLPACKQSRKSKPPEDLLDFLRAQNSDRKLLQKWILPLTHEQGESGWQRSEAIELARIMRNLTAHGILSATVATRMNIPDLCSSLTNTITDISKIALIHTLTKFSES
jgi:hypothetical protein